MYVVITPFFPNNDSFRGSFVYDYVKAVERTGQFKEIVVFIPVPPATEMKSYYYNGLKVIYFPYKFSPSYIFNGIFNRRNQRLFVRRFSELGLTPQDVRVAHAHVSNFGALALALKERNPAIITLLHHHDPDPYTVRNGRFAGFWPNLWVRAKCNFRIFKKIDFHVCISNYVKSHLLDFPKESEEKVFESYRKRLKTARLLSLTPPKDIRTIVLYNGVNTSVFYNKLLVREASDFTIGCIANFIDWKDQITLIKAVELFHRQEPSYKLHAILIGSGPLLESCRKYVEDNKLSDIVEFRPEVSHEKLSDFYNLLNLFVLPSFFEGFGCVYTEAAACGVPFIGCKGQGAMEYLTDDCYDDFTITPGNYIELAEKIEKYIRERTPQTYKYEFSIDKLVGEFIKGIKANQ